MITICETAHFELSGSRELVNETRINELLSDIKVSDPISLRLSNKSFTTESAEILSKTLNTFKNVKYADLSDIIAGRPEEEACKVLKIICDSLADCPLVEVNLSDNALGTRGVHACNAIFSKTTIEKLWINNDGLAADSVTQIATYSFPNLTLLHFHNNMSGEEGAKAMATIIPKLPLLIDFRFSATRAGSGGCLELAKSISTLDHLQCLDLCDCNFSKTAGETLCTTLSQMKHLKTLLIRDSNLGEKGVIAVLDTLAKNTLLQLEKLDISGNEIEEKGWKKISSLLTTSPIYQSLYELSIDDSECESSLLISFAKSLIHLPQLTTLSLNYGNFQVAGMVAVATVVSKLPLVHVLKADGNAICENGLKKIKKLFKEKNIILSDMEENDEEGEDDLEDFEDELNELEELSLPVVIEKDTTLVTDTTTTTTTTTTATTTTTTITDTNVKEDNSNVDILSDALSKAHI